jgi:hypothetical protein
MIDTAPPVPASLRIARDQGTRPRNGWRPSSRSTAACANDRIHEGHIPDSYLRSDAERSGNFTKRCFFRVADLNSSSKQTSAFPSPQTNNRYLTYSSWLPARHSQARLCPLNSQVAAFAIRPQRIHLHSAHPDSTAKSSLHPSRPHLVSTADVPKPP